MTKYSIYILVFSLIGALTLLSSNSAFAQSSQSSQQQQSPPLPSPSVIPPMNNETSQGFGNVTDVQNLTGLNQAAMENESGGEQQQQGNQTSNQSAAGAGSAITKNESKSNQTGTANKTAFYTNETTMVPETQR